MWSNYIAQYGADVKAETKEGVQPIHLAAQNDHGDQLARLFEVQIGTDTFIYTSSLI